MITRKKLLLFVACLLFGAMAFARQNVDSVTTVSISVKAGLQFDLVRFRVKPGEMVRIIFTNTDDMNHNLLITTPGSRMQVVKQALDLGEKGPAADYIPGSADILWAIPVVPPHDSRSIAFTAPSATGVYPYVCTLPGHGFIMYGAMYVSSEPGLPDIKTDENIPPQRRQEIDGAKAPPADNLHAGHEAAMTKPLHPFTPHAPYLYRVFIDGASPAAIAVSLPNDLSYCWDAGTCRLRFAWRGGFLDNSDLWKGKGDAAAKVVGEIFFRDTTGSPLRIGGPGDIPSAAYKGYRLINRYPEFHYTLNGMDVYELILPAPDGNGLIRTFRIPSAADTVWFCSNAADGVAYASSASKWENGRLKLSPIQARKFTLRMTINKGAAL